MVIRLTLMIGIFLSGALAISAAEGPFADRLYDKREYDWAYLEYERLLFSRADTNALLLWKYRAGTCLMLTERYEKAVDLFSAIPPNSRLGDSASLQATLCELRLGKIDAARKQLSTCRLDYAKIVSGYILFLSSRYTAAIDTLSTVADDSPNAFKAQALTKAIDAAGFRRKHPLPALALSIIPGLGHFYSGNVKDGVATAITIATGAAITGYYAYYKSQSRTITAGTVTGLLYLGGMYGAVMSVKIQNRKAIRAQHRIAERIVFDR